MKPFKMKLHRDKVITVIDDWEGVVGVYVKYPHITADDHEYMKEVLLMETTPKKADAIIKLWNSKK
jgi:hypothetical protein